MIVDLHTHTVFSDGVLIPAESARRAQVAGYAGIAITDHVDCSNYESVLAGALRFKHDGGMPTLAGVEITHVRPSQIPHLARHARELGADIVIVHGETITEPVEEGTNRAAFIAGADILAHPGLITLEDAALAASRGVYLEITTRKGHSHANGHVVKMAKTTGAKLIINNDFHTPDNYVGEAFALKVLQGAGLTLNEAKEVIQNGVKLFNERINKKN
jgi:histidinol phosphatase-like PHP family hydrolase